MSIRWLGRLAGLGIVLSTLAAAAPSTRPANRPVPKKGGDLYEMTAVWTIHLRFTADQWDALQPKQEMFGGPNRRFTPAMVVTPVFFTHGDADKDGKLTAGEMADLAGKWFTAWDKDRAGKLTADQIRQGLNDAFASGTPPQPAFRLQGPEGKRNGLAASAGVEFNYVKADLEFEGQTLRDVAVRMKGNGTYMMSRMGPKKSLKVDLNEHVKGQKLANAKMLNLHNCVTDSSWMNEVLSHKLYRDAKVPAPRTSYARVYVTAAGQHDNTFLGLYSLVEAIDDEFTERWFDEKKDGPRGALLKPVTPAPFTDLGDDWAKYNQTYDPKDDMTPEQKRRVIEFCKLVSHASDAEFDAKVAQYVDLDNASRYFAVTVWVCTLDSILGLGQNYYTYLDKTGKLHFIPWDLDHSFGQFAFVGTQEQRERMSILRPWRGEIRVLERLFKHEPFKKLYLERLAEFSRTIFQPERFDQQVDRIAAAIGDAVKAESDVRHEAFQRLTLDADKLPPPSTRPATPPGFGAGRGGGGWGAIKPIKQFVRPRHASVVAQLAGKEPGVELDNNFARNFQPQPRQGGGGPGQVWGGQFVTWLDADKDQSLTAEELKGGFGKWFAAWDVERSGALTQEQFAAGLDKQMQQRQQPGVFDRLFQGNRNEQRGEGRPDRR